MNGSLSIALGQQGAGFGGGDDLGRVRRFAHQGDRGTAVQVAVRVWFGDGVHGAGREDGVLHLQRSEQPVPHRLSEWLAIDLFNNETQQRIVGIVVLVSCTGRGVGWARKSNGQQLSGGPNLGWVIVNARRDFGGVGVIGRDRCASPAAG